MGLCQPMRTGGKGCAGQKKAAPCLSRGQGAASVRCICAEMKRGGAAQRLTEQAIRRKVCRSPRMAME